LRIDEKNRNSAGELQLGNNIQPMVDENSQEIQALDSASDTVFTVGFATMVL